MNHREFEKLLYPYLDGELDAAQEREVELHLESSAEARAIVDFKTSGVQQRSRSRDLPSPSAPGRDPTDLAEKLKSHLG